MANMKITIETAEFTVTVEYDQITPRVTELVDGLLCQLDTDFAVGDKGPEPPSVTTT